MLRAFLDSNNLLQLKLPTSPGTDSRKQVPVVEKVNSKKPTTAAQGNTAKETAKPLSVPPPKGQTEKRLSWAEIAEKPELSAVSNKIHTRLEDTKKALVKVFLSRKAEAIRPSPVPL